MQRVKIPFEMRKNSRSESQQLLGGNLRYLHYSMHRNATHVGRSQYSTYKTKYCSQISNLNFVPSASHSATFCVHSCVAVTMMFRPLKVFSQQD
jgi:hypothetical protein